MLGAAALGPMLPHNMADSFAPADDITSLSAVEMAARIKRKELSAREVLEAHLTRIGRVNPRVNAIVTLVARD
jgi:amidase